MWTNLALGGARAGRALAASGLGNPFEAINSGAVPVRSNRSLDVVLATGVTF